MKLFSRFSILLGLLLCTAGFSNQLQAQQYLLRSPNEAITVSVDEGLMLSLRISMRGEVLVEELKAYMEIDEVFFGQNAMVVDASYSSADQLLEPAVPTIASKIRDQYNQLRLDFEADDGLGSRYSIEIRAYDHGVAYRWLTWLSGEVKVNYELVDMQIPEDFRTFFPEEETLISHYERSYTESSVGDIETGRFCSLPVLFISPKGKPVLFSEADHFDYPGLFLMKRDRKSFGSLFPGKVLESSLKPGSDRDEDLVLAHDHIAVTRGERSFPWRVFMLGESEKDLLSSDLVWQLSREQELKQTSWIKPGKVAWDWWNALNLEGVDFETGVNNTTYKYYIDFASEYGLEYIILDEGWTASTSDLLHCNPDINVEELVAYGKNKGVGVILWTLWRPLDEKLEEVLDLYASWGVKGIKVDFMQRADQDMVLSYEQIAREAAERKLLVDYHGAFKPAGMRRALPNIISYEGVKGLENCKWSDEITPQHNLVLPFTRNVVGPMDYTPGAMDNAHPDNFTDRFTRPMSMGTRAHMVAMYIIYVSPIQMLSDTPSKYYREPETTSFISAIPTTWDETRVLEGETGSHILLARRKGEKWYVAAMNGREGLLELELDLSLLGDSQAGSSGGYKALIMEDGSNADRIATDHRISEKQVSSTEKLRISMVQGGGWAAILSPR